MGSVHATKIGFLVATLDVSLEPEMHSPSKEPLGNDHLGLRKTPDLPDLRFIHDS